MCEKFCNFVGSSTRPLKASGSCRKARFYVARPTLGNAPVKEGFHQPFSLLFRGPLNPRLEQGVVTLENATLGEIALFLVPVGLEDDSMLYDVTFN